MPLTAEQHTSIAGTYDEAAADPLIAPEQRAEFAKKADLFRQLARLETKRTGVATTPDSSTLPASEGRKSRPKYLLASLWLIGSALYVTGTLLFTLAVNPAEDDAKTTTISKEAGVPTDPRQSDIESTQPARADLPQLPALAPPPAIASAIADRRHAISPDEPAYESPDLSIPPSVANVEPGSRPAPSATPEQAAYAQPGEALEVIETATVRSAPSTAAEKIGTASPGAALQVTARDGDWVEFVDPASGNTGWIHASLIGPAPGSAASPEADAEAEVAAPVPAPKQPDAGKKRTAEKPGATPQAAKQRNARPSLPPPPQRRYADLPDDEEFFLQEPRPGILARRRMMREGLMSPGFLPPR